MSKPLIDGKKLNESPSFGGLSPSPRTTASYASSKSSNRPLDNPQSFDKDPKEAKNKESSKVSSSSSAKFGLERPDQSDKASTKDDLASLDLDPIFRKLCGKDQFKNEPNCSICSKSFSTLKLIIRKNCNFCGNCICEDHGKKKRPNPENINEYVRICDLCDEKHIKRIILKEFDERMKRKEKDVSELEKRIKEQQVAINDAQREYDTLLVQKTRNDKNYSDQIAFLTNDITRIKEETKKCEKENTLLTKDFNDTQKKVEQLDSKIQEAQQEYERLQIESSTLNKQIEAVNQDINKITKRMMEIEEIITQNKLGQAQVPSGNFYVKSVGQNDDKNTEKFVSFHSSLMSERTERIKGHYENSKLNGISKKKTNKEDDSLSISNPCEVKCNIF